MFTTIWDVQKQIRAGETQFGADPGAPYAASATVNYLERWEATTRTSTKRDHGLSHCLKMAEHAHADQKWALAMDWLIAAFSFVATRQEVESFEDTMLRLLWAVPVLAEKRNWGELLSNKTNALDQRLIAATAAFLISAADDSLVRCHEPILQKLLEAVQQRMPDVCHSFQMGKETGGHEQITSVRNLGQWLDEKLSDLKAASGSQDIHAFCALQHSAIQSLTHKAVAAIAGPFLPDRFAKSRLPSFFAALQRIREAPQSQLAQICESGLATVDSICRDVE